MAPVRKRSRRRAPAVYQNGDHGLRPVMVTVAQRREPRRCSRPLGSCDRRQQYPLAASLFPARTCASRHWLRTHLATRKYPHANWRRVRITNPTRWQSKEPVLRGGRKLRDAEWSSRRREILSEHIDRETLEVRYSTTPGAVEKLSGSAIKFSGNSGLFVGCDFTPNRAGLGRSPMADRQFLRRNNVITLQPLSVDHFLLDARGGIAISGQQASANTMPPDLGGHGDDAADEGVRKARSRPCRIAGRTRSSRRGSRTRAAATRCTPCRWKRQLDQRDRIVEPFARLLHRETAWRGRH